jgi:hypothetical protein
MTRILSVFVLMTLLLAGAAAAQTGSFGLGIILGEPTGISFKQWLSDRNALDGAAAWSFGNVSAFHVHMDYLYHGPLSADIDHGGFLYYVGIGGRLKATEGDSRIGIRIPLGLDYVFDDTPIDIFFEVAPILDLAPSTDFRMNGSLGLRYFF